MITININGQIDKIIIVNKDSEANTDVLTEKITNSLLKVLRNDDSNLNQNTVNGNRAVNDNRAKRD